MSDSNPPSRQDQLDRMANQIKEAQKRYPDADFKLETQWWAPVINFGADLNETLDPETNAKFSACIGKLKDQKFNPAMIPETRSEAMTILAGYPKIFEQVDETIFQKEDIWRGVHEYAMKEEREGRDAFNPK